MGKTLKEQLREIRGAGRVTVLRRSDPPAMVVFECFPDAKPTCDQPKCNKPEVARCGYQLGHAMQCGDRSLDAKGPACAPNCRRGDTCNKALCLDHRQSNLDQDLLTDYCPAHAKFRRGPGAHSHG